jgi:acyl-CoA thioesterase
MAKDAVEIARASAEAMWAGDRWCHRLGIELIEVGPGFARLAMTVGEDMTNGHGAGHGGVTFSLADAAFGFACNSRGRRAVAHHCTIAFVAPVRPGMRLIAEASERQRGERSGIYDVTVRDDEGAVIAEFRGHARMLSPDPTGVE